METRQDVQSGSDAAAHAGAAGDPAPVTTSRAVNRDAHRRWRAQARAAAAVVAGRTSGALARRLRLGGGTSLPGLVARRVDPAIVEFLGSQLRHGSVVITGTNGKTTTSGLVAYVLRADGLRVWRNREGANLVRGITASLIIRSRPTGSLRWHGNAAMVCEVDEAAFPQVIAELEPRAVVVTNLFRDQLDRYGEVDTVAERWREALHILPASSRLVLNADDPTVAALADPAHVAGALYFGLADAPAADDAGMAGSASDVIDTRTCPRCRTPLAYSVRFYSHVGHWACPGCGFARPRPAIYGQRVQPEGLEATRFTLVSPTGEQDVRLPLPGLYNVYNALAAAATGVALGVDGPAVGAALGRFMPAFGRAERLSVEGRDVRLLLAKNPTGLNEVLRALAAVGHGQHLLMLLNDKPADGEDVSWIWDADVERVATMEPASLTVSGTRAYDLGLRLKYAGRPPGVIEPDPVRALSLALEATPAGATLFIVPTYTAMLAVREVLRRTGYVRGFWED